MKKYTKIFIKTILENLIIEPSKFDTFHNLHREYFDRFDSGHKEWVAYFLSLDLALPMILESDYIVISLNDNDGKDEERLFFAFLTKMISRWSEIESDDHEFDYEIMKKWFGDLYLLYTDIDKFGE